MARRLNYSSILRQRALLAALTLGLVTIIFGLFLELIIASTRTTIPSNVRRLIEPLNPVLDLTVIERLESYPRVTIEQARQAVPAVGTVPLEENQQ